MWLDRDVARSDVVLATSAAAFGPGVIFAVLSFVGPGFLVEALLLQVALIVTIGLVPWLLARNRGDGWQAFGRSDGDASTMLAGVAVGLPMAAISILIHLNNGGSVFGALQGRLNGVGPTIGQADPTLLVVLFTTAISVGVSAWLLMSFLTIRSRDGFRANEIDLTELLRTYGLAMVGASAVLGMLRTLQGLGLTNALLAPLAGLAIILLADRQIPARVTVNRSMVIGPLIAWGVIVFFQNGGNLFAGNPLIPLHRAAASGILVVAVASLIAAKRTRMTIPIIAIATLYPTCLGPFHVDILFGLTSTC